MKNKGWLSIEKKYCDMRKNKDLLTFAVFKKQLKQRALTFCGSMKKYKKLFFPLKKLFFQVGF